jgi:hypothetical protein
VVILTATIAFLPQVCVIAITLTAATDWEDTLNIKVLLNPYHRDYNSVGVGKGFVVVYRDFGTKVVVVEEEEID